MSDYDYCVFEYAEKFEITYLAAEFILRMMQEGMSETEAVAEADLLDYLWD